MKIVWIILSVGLNLWVDLQACSLENLKEVDISLGVLSDVDRELWQEAESVINPDLVLEIELMTPD